MLPTFRFSKDGAAVSEGGCVLVGLVARTLAQSPRVERMRVLRLGGAVTCYCRTTDAGKPRARPSDCQNACELPWERAIGLRGLVCDDTRCDGDGGTMPAGTCSQFRGRVFGCRGRIDETVQGGRRVRTAGAVCID